MKVKIEVTELTVKDFVGLTVNQESLDAIPRLLERLQGKFQVPIGGQYSSITIDPMKGLAGLVKNIFDQLGKMGRISTTVGKFSPITIELTVSTNNKSEVKDA